MIKLNFDDDDWIIHLNRYQRDNLLLLLNIVGHGGGEDNPGLEPFSYMNTGDWIGEIALMIADTKGSMKAEDTPGSCLNKTYDEVAHDLNIWKNNLIPKVSQHGE